MMLLSLLPVYILFGNAPLVLPVITSNVRGGSLRAHAPLAQFMPRVRICGVAKFYEYGVIRPDDEVTRCVWQAHAVH